MGNALVCFEGGSWDSHNHVRTRYKPGSEPQQDMTHPLSHYFISSGHNSYLTGNQLTSSAGTHTIETGLKLGCRVIELDVYDGPNGQPICTHGGTLTSAVTFKDCIRCIGRHGFHAGPYPVILTIENHAGMEQQVTMAKELHDVLGRHLFEPQPQQLEKDGSWLSPESLKHKVLIRMKIKAGAVAPELAKLVYICNSKIDCYDVAAGPALPSSHSLPDNKLPDIPEFAGYIRQSSPGGDRQNKGGTLDALKKSYNDIQQAVTKAASSKTTSPVTSGGGDKAAAPVNPKAAAAAAEAAVQEQLLSVEKDDTVTDGIAAGSDANRADAAAAAAVESTCALPAGLSSAPLSKVCGYTSKHLLRCYPSGWRMINNSNPNPTHAWSIGASLAALNWQLWDEALWINQAFFSRFNSSGYILKPDWMTTDIPNTGLPGGRTPRTLCATIYSAHKHQGKNFGITKDDPYVELKVKGLPCDSSAVRSSHVNDSGRLVVDKTFELPVTIPELAVLLVLLKDLNVGTTDVVLGYAALPLATLMPGEYKVHLAEPFVLSEHPREPHDMWVKLKLEWQEDEPAAAAAAGQVTQQ